MFFSLQLDGGITFTEPTAIICGEVEGRSDVSGMLWKHCQQCSTAALLR
jgi:hypothetical protein